MFGKGKGKRHRGANTKMTRDFSSPQTYNQTRKKNVQSNHNAPSRDWMTDDDASIADVQTPDKDINGSTLETDPIGHDFDGITCGTIKSCKRHRLWEVPTKMTLHKLLPLVVPLNIAASASSLREDFALCEQVMTEKHQFVVTILDGMNKKVDNIALQINNLEQRVEVIEKKSTYSPRKCSVYFPGIKPAPK